MSVCSKYILKYIIKDIYYERRLIMKEMFQCLDPESPALCKAAPWQMFSSPEESHLQTLKRWCFPLKDLKHSAWQILKGWTSKLHPTA
jgi:hypothetical protein